MSELQIAWGTTLGILVLYLLFAGGLELWRWHQLKIGNYFGVRWDWMDHFWLGVRLLIYGGVGTGLYAYGVFGRNGLTGLWRSLGMLLITLGLFWWLVVTPFFLTVPLLGAHLESGYAVKALGSQLIAWHEEHGRYPSSEAELRTAVSMTDEESPYTRAGKVISYRLVYVEGVGRPAFPEDPPGEPGLIYCAINLDSQHFWLATTVLTKPVGRSTAWLRGPGGSTVFDTDFFLSKASRQR